MPEEGVQLLKHSEILTLEEIFDFVKVAVELGIEKVRITGGEPLIRRNVLELIRNIAALQGIKDLSLTTNGILLEDFAQDLFESGLHRINISLDTLDKDRFYALTRGGDINKVFSGIRAAKLAGLFPIKVNCVVQQHSQEADALAVKAFCEKEGLEARFIHQMQLHTGSFSTVEGGSGGDCSVCSRLRLTSDGKLKPCLFNDLEFDIRKLGFKEALHQATQQKPPCGTHNLTNAFHNIGG